MSDFELMLTADSRGLVSGEKALDSIASTAERTQTRAGKALEGVGKAANDVGKQSIYAGQQMRMTSMQLSQVAQQASVTGNWLQAIAIQLPDLALGFGTFGILAGAAAGALLPLAANFLTADDNAVKLDETMKSLAAATEAYERAMDNASLSAETLVERFGDQAEEAQKAYEAMLRMAELDYYQSMKKAQDDITASMEQVTGAVDRFRSATSNMLPQDAIVAAEQEIQYLKRAFDLTIVEAQNLSNALQDLASATGPEEAAAAALEFSNAIDEAAAKGAKITPEMREIQQQALQASVDALRFSNMLGQANGEAAALEGTMIGVADQAGRAANNIAAALNAQQTAAVVGQLGSLDPLNGFNRTPFQDELQLQNERANNTKSQYQIAAEKAARSGRRGGRSAASKSLDDDHREATRLWEETRTEAEKYQKELDNINDLHNRGFINADTYARAVKQIGEEYQGTGEAAKFFEEINEDLKNGILDAILEGENLGDVFEDLAKKIARAALEAALFGSGPLSGGKGGGGGIFSSIMGGLKLFSFEGGGSTGPGSRSGGMDGRGGFLAMVHPNETIIDHAKGQAGTISYRGGDLIVQGNITDQRTLNEVRKMMAQQEGRIQKGFGKSVDARVDARQSRGVRG